MADPVRVGALAGRLQTPARDDQLLVVDVSEPLPGDRSKRADLGLLLEAAGDYAEPSADQQLALATAYRLSPAGAVTDADIGGRGGQSWQLTTAAAWAALPAESAADQAERRGHGVLTRAGAVWTLRLSTSTLYWPSGVSRRDVTARLEAVRQWDTIQLGPWTDRDGGDEITAQYLVAAPPLHDAATSSYVWTLRQLRTGAAPTPAHLAPSAGAHPRLGVSLGIRQQQPTPYSDAAPQALGAAAAAGVSRDLSRADHVHPRPTLADLGLTTQRELRRDSAAGAAGSDLQAAIGAGGEVRALCSDGAHVWALPAGLDTHPRLVAWTVAGARAAGSDIVVAPPLARWHSGVPQDDRAAAGAAACDGSHIWATQGAGWMRAWTVAGARAAALDLDLGSGIVGIPWLGACTDGTHIWAVQSRAATHIRAWRIGAGAPPARDAAADIPLADLAAGLAPQGLATDGTTLWAATGDAVLAWRLSTRARDLSGDVAVPGADAARGLVVAGGRLYTAGPAAGGIRAYRFLSVAAVG